MNASRFVLAIYRVSIDLYNEPVRHAHYRHARRRQLALTDAYPVRAVGLGDGYRARLNMHGVVPVDGVDVDVVGGLNIKKKFGDNALSIFIQPPSVEVLRQRLTGRGTDAPEKIEQRLAKAEYEMTFADKFDTIIVNDKLEEAFREAEKKVRDFLK